MPVVPVYNNAQVQEQNLPGVQVRPAGARFDAAGSMELAALPGRQLQQFGDAVTRAGGAMASIANDELQRANQIRVNDAMNQAAKIRLDLTYAPGSGFTHLRGENALKRPGDAPLDVEYTDKLTTQLAEIEKGLGNDEQRVLFRTQASQLVTQFQGNLTQHIAREYTDYEVSVQDGTIAVGREQMALSWSDPAALKQAQSAIKAAVYAKGELLGLSAKQIEANTVEALSPAHAAVVTSAIDSGNVGYAKEYLKQVNAELTPAARLEMQRLVETGDFEQRTQYAAGDLFAKHGGDIAAALAEAREKFSGKEEDSIVTRLKTLDSEREALHTRRQRDASSEAWRIYSETGSIASIPATVLGTMDGKDLQVLRNTARADAAGKPIETDPEVYYALTLAAASDPGFAAEDLRSYFDKLSPTDRKHFIDMQAKLMEPGEFDEFATTTQQINAMVNTFELDDKQAGVFHRVAAQSLMAEQMERGRKLTQGERQAVLDRLVLQGNVPRDIMYGSRDVMAFQAIAEGRPFTAVWTSDQKRQATAALQRQGIQNPTPAQVDAVLRATYGN